MPLPSKAMTMMSSCNCTAICYRVSTPPISERPLHPASDPSSGKEPVRLPFFCIDHCKDCRRATGALLGFVLCSPTAYVEMSLLPPSDVGKQNQHSINQKPDQKKDIAERSWIPATSIFPPETLSHENTTLSFYESSEGRTRAFCLNCRTQFAFSAYPYPDAWPRMLDIWIGSVDREVLEKEWLVLERNLWWDYGVEWVRKWGSEEISGMPKHGDYRIDEEIGIERK